MAKRGNHVWIQLKRIQFKRRVKAELLLAVPTNWRRVATNATLKSGDMTLYLHSSLSSLAQGAWRIAWKSVTLASYMTVRLRITYTKSTHCSCRGSRFRSQHYQAAHNISFKESNAFFGHQSHTWYTWHMHIFTYRHSHISIKINITSKPN